MKTRLLILFLLVSGAAFAQPTPGKYTPINQALNWRLGYFRGLHVPAGDSAALQPDQWPGAGALYIDTTGADSGFYYRSKFGLFKKVGTGSGTGGNDSAYVNYTVSGDTMFWYRDNGGIDTLLLGGAALSNLGSGYRIYSPPNNGFRTLINGYGITWDSATANSLKATADTATLFPAVRATITGGGGGITTVGTINSQSKSSNGLVISGSSIYAQTVDGTFPGLMTPAQKARLDSNSYIAIDKTLDSLAWYKNDSTLYIKSINLSIPSATVTKTITDSTINYAVTGIGGSYTYKEAIKETSGVVSINNRRDVVILDQTFTAGSLPAGFTAVGSPTFTADGTGIHFTGSGSGTYTQYIRADMYELMENCEVRTYFKVDAVTGTDGGIAAGHQSANAAGYAHSMIGDWIADASNGNYGKAHIFGATGSYNAYSDSAKTAYSVNDQFVISLFREGLSYIEHVTNITKGWTVSRRIDVTTPVSPYIPHNVSRPAFYHKGGSFTVTRFMYIVKAPVITDQIILGNSIVHGQGASSPLTRWAANVGNPANNILAGGGADVSQSVRDHLNEIIAINPKRVLLDIGGNDILFGVAAATWKGNLIYIYNTLTAAGIEVIFVYPNPRTATDISALVTFMDTCNVFNLARKIRTPWTEMKDGGTGLKTEYDADGTHPNTAGHQFKAYLVNVGLNFPVVLSIQNQSAAPQANSTFSIDGIGKTGSRFEAKTSGAGNADNTGGYIVYGATGTGKGQIGYDVAGNYMWISALTPGVAYRHIMLQPPGVGGAFVSIGGTTPTAMLHVSNTDAGTTTIGRFNHAGSFSANYQKMMIGLQNAGTDVSALGYYVGPSSSIGMSFYTMLTTTMNTNPALRLSGANKAGINLGETEEPLNSLDINGDLRIRTVTLGTAVDSVLVKDDGIVKYVDGAGFGGGTGTDNLNVGSGYRWVKPASQNIKTVFAGLDILIDSSSNTDGLTIKLDTATAFPQIRATISGGGAGNDVNNQFATQQNARFWINGRGETDSAFAGRTTGAMNGFKTGGLFSYGAGTARTSWLQLGYDNTLAAGWIQSATEGTAYRDLFINNAGGFVGIGLLATLPTSLLHLRTTTAGTHNIFRLNHGGSYSAQDQELQMAFQNAGSDKFIISNYAGPSSEMGGKFYTSNTIMNTTPVLRLSGLNRVGINLTTEPRETLDVDGLISYRGATLGTSTDSICTIEDGRIKIINASAFAGGITALTGPITASGTGSVATTITDDAVTYAKMQNVSATSRIMGRITASAGDMEELTGTQATSLLDVFTTSVKGLVPAATGGNTTTEFLRKDGSWQVPGGSASSGGYTPTITNGTNVSSSSNISVRYFIIGTRVTVIGAINVTATSGSIAGPVNTVVSISLPAAGASNFTAATDASGMMGESLGYNGVVTADASGDLLVLTYGATSTSSRSISFTASYDIL